VQTIHWRGQPAVTILLSSRHGARDDRVGQTRGTSSAVLPTHAEEGDCLVVVDDFVAEGPHGKGTRKLRAAVSRGWRAPSLCTFDALTARAARAGWGMEAEEDWTARVSRGTGMLRVLAALLVLLDGLPLGEVAAGLAGGAALLLGYRRGAFRYRYVRFRRDATG